MGNGRCQCLERAREGRMRLVERQQSVLTNKLVNCLWQKSASSTYAALITFWRVTTKTEVHTSAGHECELA
eukprot:6201648-Pleurochrysis_carterae.AAC.2